MISLKKIGLLFLIFDLTHTISAEYIRYENISMEYQLHTKLMKWNDARKFCKSQQAELAMPKNEKEAEIIKNIFNSVPMSELIQARKARHMILGFHDMFNEGEFLIEDGSSIQYAYNKWERNEPKGWGHENCGSMSREGLIDDFPCDIPSIFICQKDIAQDVQETVSMNEKCKTHDFGYEYAEDIKKCYKYHIDPRPWFGARAICQAEGGHLAIIKSEAEEKFLVEMSKDSFYQVTHVRDRTNSFIGFHDIFEEGSYVTVEGNDLGTTGFIKWATGKVPSTSRYNNCGALKKSGGLDVVCCDHVLPFICEKNAGASEIDVRLSPENYPGAETDPNTDIETML